MGADSQGWEGISGLNAGYLADLYERYRADAASVEPATRAFFERWGAPPGVNGRGAPIGERQEGPARGVEAALVAGAVELATSIRDYGYRAARLDPLGSPPPGDAALLAESHGTREGDLAALPASIVGGPLAEKADDALAAIRALREVYESATGYEFEHVSNAVERDWLRDAVESGRFRPPRSPIDEKRLLDRLTEAGAFERFLHVAFPGQTRFSLEGLGMLIPMLDEFVAAAAQAGARTMLIGMAHRGRLNVLAHTLGKPYQEIIGEFLGGHYQEASDETGGESWTGDVKYHLGAVRAYRNGAEVEMQVYLAPNPSHLEWINPVVLGMDRACDERRDAPGPARQDEQSSQAVLIHGDASFCGQGIVAETLNLSQLPGYRTGGTLHLITNNQLGFTTSPEQGRSTLFASDLARGFEIPIIHVNADEAEACIAAARLAYAYRLRFGKDVLIDLVGYRRWGHNEGDEPGFTQPRLYARIAEHPTVRERFAAELAKRGVVTAEESDRMLQAAIERLQEMRRALLAEKESEQGPWSRQTQATAGMEAGGQGGGLGRAGAAASVETAVPSETLALLNEQLYGLPAGFHLHPKLERTFARRREAVAGMARPPDPRHLQAGNRLGGIEQAISTSVELPEARGDRQATGPTIEWSHAEALAFASILADETPIRLTGQDTARGTFSQRHAVLYDAQTGAPHTPLQSLPAARASFEVWNSPLSEQATLGFEFGYTVQAPEALDLWEAQYGDFINVAQPVIDLFIASGRTKWGQSTGLVLLLPHGYEGQGPEHSSARVERFLQLAAEDNFRIANCTTAAQFFHILRRQMLLLKLDPRPLVLLTPKSLLRHPGAASPVSAFTHGRFEPVLGDERAARDPGAVRRLVLCSGKVYFDVMAHLDKAQGEDAAPSANGSAALPAGVNTQHPTPNTQHPTPLAVARIEELYPFPAREVSTLVESFPALEEVVWVQEEPRNMGPWPFVAPRLRDLLRGRLPLFYVGRTRRASPAEGAREWHTREQQRLVEAACQRAGAPARKREVEHAG